MRLNCLVFVVCAALTAPSIAAVQGKAPDMAPVDIRRVELSPGVFQFQVAADGYVEQLNSIAVIGDTGVLLFDTTTRPSTARRILAEIRALTAKPVRWVVNSHWHPDHWSGNEVFAAANPDLEIIATEQMRDFMLTLTPFFGDYIPKGVPAQEKAVAELVASGKDEVGAPLTPESRAKLELELQQVRDMAAEQAKLRRTYPNLTYTDRMVVRRGGREFHLISVTGDAEATTVLYMPRERLLLTGDAVSYPLPYHTPPLSRHARSLRDLARLDTAIIVPGHGPAFRDKAYLLLQAELFEAVVARTQAALRGGATTIDQVQKAVSFDDFRPRFARGDPRLDLYFPQFTSGMVRTAFVELRDGKAIR